MEMAIAEARESLRPRNISVPSYRPIQQEGCTFVVRQFGSGSGEGQHTSSLFDHRRMYGAGAGVQSTAESSGIMASVLLGVH
jgi:hypothetical protein